MATLESNLKYEQAVAVLKCLARTDQARNLVPTIVVGCVGDIRCQNVSVDADGYRFSFHHMLGAGGKPILSLRKLTTPKGSQYIVLGKDPMKELSAEDKAAIITQIVDRKTDDGITVEAIYVVMKDGCAVGPMYDRGLGAKGKPFPAAIQPNRFYDKAEAEVAAEKFREYLSDLHAKNNKKKK